MLRTINTQQKSCNNSYGMAMQIFNLNFSTILVLSMFNFLGFQNFQTSLKLFALVPDYPESSNPLNIKEQILLSCPHTFPIKALG